MHPEPVMTKTIGSFTFTFRPETNDEFVLISDIIEHQYTACCTLLPDDIWLDIGGHIGGTAIEFAHHVKGIVSYEPFPGNYDLLCQNIALNGVTNVQTYPYAVVGNTDRERQLAIHQRMKSSPQYTGSHSFYAKGRRYQKIAVPCRNILDIIKETGARNLKIDTEGEEHALIEAIQDWDAIDEIIFEWHPRLVGDPTFIKYHQTLTLMERNFEHVHVDPTPFDIGQVVVHAVKQRKLDRKETS